MAQISEQLKVLSIFHYVVAGLYGVYFLMVGLFTGVGVGIGFLMDPKTSGSMPPDVRMKVMLITGGIGAVLMLLGLAYVVLTAWSGVCIAKRKRRHFSLVMASVNFLAFPFGTALGVVTFIMLRKERIVWWYAGGEQQI